MPDVVRNQGALVLGGFIATWLSGMVTVQTLLYFKLYPLDTPILKALVTFLWALDFTHSGLVITSVWSYVIQDFENAAAIDDIHVLLAITFIFTAIVTFIVHCFFVHRIFLLSRGSWIMTMPILFLAICRICSAAATCVELIRVDTFSSFRDKFLWLFALGLALSSMVDVLITLCLFALLQKSRTQSMILDHVIDSLILYAFEIGCLTCAGTIASMICWLVMSDNQIFMGLHFAIGKLYENSLLAALNTRHHLRTQRRQPSRAGRRNTFQVTTPNMDPDIPLPQVHINIEKSITYDPMTPGSSEQGV